MKSDFPNVLSCPLCCIDWYRSKFDMLHLNFHTDRHLHRHLHRHYRNFTDTQICRSSNSLLNQTLEWVHAHHLPMMKYKWTYIPVGSAGIEDAVVTFVSEQEVQMNNPFAKNGKLQIGVIWESPLEVHRYFSMDYRCFSMDALMDGKKSLIFTQYMRGIMKKIRMRSGNFFRVHFIHGIEWSDKFGSPLESSSTTSVDYSLDFPKHRRMGCVCNIGYITNGKHWRRFFMDLEIRVFKMFKILDFICLIGNLILWKLIYINFFIFFHFFIFSKTRFLTTGMLSQYMINSYLRFLENMFHQPRTNTVNSNSDAISTSLMQSCKLLRMRKSRLGQRRRSRISFAHPVHPLPLPAFIASLILYAPPSLPPTHTACLPRTAFPWYCSWWCSLRSSSSPQLRSCCLPLFLSALRTFADSLWLSILSSHPLGLLLSS